jgi:hypothetical protein
MSLRHIRPLLRLLSLLILPLVLSQNVTLDDADASITYSGRWNLQTGTPSFVEGTIHFTTSANASAKFNFTGIGLSFFPVLTTNGGPLLVEIGNPIEGEGVVQYHLTSLQGESVSATTGGGVGTFLDIANLQNTTHEVTITNQGSTQLIIDFFTCVSYFFP